MKTLISLSHIIVAAISLVIGMHIADRVFPVPDFTDVIVALSAAITAGVALKGLFLWKSQVKWRTRYELAKRLLKLTFQFREAVQNVREQDIGSFEIEDTEKRENLKKRKDEGSYYALAQLVYTQRFQKVAEFRSLIEADLLEAKIIWGAETVQPFQKLFRLIKELDIAVYFHLALKNPDADPKDKKIIREAMQKRRDVLYRDINEESEEKDAFSKDLDAKVSEIERIFLPFLKS